MKKYLSLFILTFTILLLSSCNSSYQSKNNKNHSSKIDIDELTNIDNSYINFWYPNELKIVHYSEYAPDSLEDSYYILEYSEENSSINNNIFIYVTPYDTEVDHVGDFTLASSSIPDSTGEIDCSFLKNDLLPISFDWEHICYVLNINNNPVLYAIGISHPYEALPELESIIISFQEEKAFIIYNLIPYLALNKLREQYVEEFVRDHLNIEFMSYEWKDLYTQLDIFLNNMMENPNEEIINQFQLLEKIAESVEH